ncbi:hypothetical protein CWN74_20930, partial [Klebsiella pneumoniae]|uniref:FimD/PapC C-terminal domain-containing protein n=1 Tax=Klebsiella pneumoniae TaxID=573 RepID=UPI000CB4E286
RSTLSPSSAASDVYKRRLYARVPQDHGSVSVVWGERSGQRCRLAYAIRDDAAQQVSSPTPHQVCRPGIKEK